MEWNGMDGWVDGRVGSSTCNLELMNPFATETKLTANKTVMTFENMVELLS